MVLPDVMIDGNSKLVEYNREWSLNAKGKYECEVKQDRNGTPLYEDSASEYM